MHSAAGNLLQPRQELSHGVESDPAIELLLWRLGVVLAKRRSLWVWRFYKHGVSDADVERVLDEEAQILWSRLAEFCAYGGMAPLWWLGDVT